MRPALVCGWVMKPSSSSAAMSLRTVAGLTRSECRSARLLDPTGSLVDTKSSTMARRTSSLRSSSTGSAPPGTRHYRVPSVRRRPAPGLLEEAGQRHDLVGRRAGDDVAVLAVDLA